MHKDAYSRVLTELDLDYVRVLEDLIEVLLQKDVITLDLFPPDAVRKIQTRREMRQQSKSNAVGIEEV